MLLSSSTLVLAWEYMYRTETHVNIYILISEKISYKIKFHVTQTAVLFQYLIFGSNKKFVHIPKLFIDSEIW